MNKIAIHSVPRSGSTWLGSIFDSHPNVAYRYQPLFSYSFKSELKTNSTKKEIEDFFRRITLSNDPFINQITAKEKGIVPSFSKQEPLVTVYKEVRYHHIIKNLLIQTPEIKVIGLIRHPLATLYSWINAPKEFRADLDWIILEEWKLAPKKNKGLEEEFNGYEKWKEVANLFEILKKEFPTNFYLLRYDELLDSPETTVKHLFNFVNLDFNIQTLNFLQASTSKELKDSYSVFKTKKKDDAWTNNLDKDIVNYINNDLKGTNLEKYLY